MSPVLDSIRDRLGEEDLDYYWVPSSDEFLNEYVVARAKRLHFLSGFSGSAGNIVIGRESAWLFVDGRYHVQAPQEVDTSLFDVQKIGAPGAVDHVTFLMGKAASKNKLRVGVDPHCLSSQQFQSLAEALEKLGGKLIAVEKNLVDSSWDKRPQPQFGEIEKLPDSIDRHRFQDRLERVRQALRALGCDGTVVQKLDQIAWLFGRRGQDIEFNPVFESLLVIGPKDLWLFLHKGQQGLFSDEQDIHIEDYGQRMSRLTTIFKELGQDCRWFLDPHRVTQGVISLLSDSRQSCGIDVIEQLKSRKTEDEAAAMERAGLLASAAKVKAFCWLDSQLESGHPVSELTFRDHLANCYGAMPGFRGLSFSVISSVGPNSAICHYSTPNPEATLEEGQFFLVDSGAHYIGGTTDATRTIYIGENPSAEHKRVYTLVLKAHIACARLRFPVGTIGVQLDAITRAPLWNAGADYIHGTGHGVGAWLNVHEGPMGIGLPARGHSSEQPIAAGQVLSIEPGLYREGWGGTRIENLYLVENEANDELGRENLRFKALTWLPLSCELMDKSLLTFEEVDWINAYHREVLERLTHPPSWDRELELLNESEKAWLIEHCRSL